MRNGMAEQARQLRRADVVQSSVGLTDCGLVLGAGAVLVRMAGAGASSRLALDTDRDRLIALLAVAHGKPIEGADVLHHVEAAARHWQRGDKALANLRLVLARLPRAADPAAVARLTLAEEVLDGGLAPDALMTALWPDAAPETLVKYNPDEPRVPAGNSIESGRWEFGDTAPNPRRDRGDRIRVAAEDAPDGKEDVPHLHPDFAGRPEVTVGPTHVPLLDPLTGLPAGGKTGALADKVSAAAKAAAAIVGPGRGPVYGTAVHTELKNQIKASGEQSLHVEQSYLLGKRVNYGTPGSVRVDAAEGDKERPHTVYDLKTGSAQLTDTRIKQLRKHQPNGETVDIREVRP